MSQFRWRVSRWPFQKTVALSLESVQCSMTASVMRIEKVPFEPDDHFFRRRRREARNTAMKAGSWACVWARRLQKWHAHCLRQNTVLKSLLEWHDVAWLRERRSNYVTSNVRNILGISRNSLFAGNTGTRIVGGRPEPRLQESLELAGEIVRASRKAERSNNLLTLHTVLQRASSTLRGMFDR